jgi:hypothetical protein
VAMAQQCRCHGTEVPVVKKRAVQDVRGQETMPHGLIVARQVMVDGEEGQF